MSYSSEVLADNPTAYWRLGESSGTFADSSGNGHTATASGSVTRDVANGSLTNGNDDGAVSFPTGSDYLTVTDHADLDLGNGPFTIEFWAKRGADVSASGYATALAKGSGSYAVAISGDGSGVGDQMILNKDQVDNVSAPLTPDPVPVDEWHHWVIVRNTTSDTDWWYDAVLQTTEFDNAVTLADTTTDLRIGRDPAGADLGWGGSLDEIALYKTALSSTRIAAHYAARSTAPAATNVQRFIFG